MRKSDQNDVRLDNRQRAPTPASSDSNKFTYDHFLSQGPHQLSKTFYVQPSNKVEAELKDPFASEQSKEDSQVQSQFTALQRRPYLDIYQDASHEQTHNVGTFN